MADVTPEERDLTLIKRILTLAEELRAANGGVHELMIVDDMKRAVRDYREREVRAAIAADRALSHKPSHLTP